MSGSSAAAASTPPCSAAVQRAYLTIIDAAAENSDTFFPNLDKLPGWEIEEKSEPMTENGITFRFVTYINNKHCDAHIPINPQHLPL